MGIGNRIKEARNNLGYTQEELAKLLGVTKGAVANYELETSHPKEPVMYKLIEVLRVDANYLFQDCVNIPKELNNVTLAEFEHIKKYRIIKEYSPKGKESVDYILNREYDLATEIAKGKSVNDKIVNHSLDIKAAHERTDIEVTDEMRKHDDDIMDDENF